MTKGRNKKTTVAKRLGAVLLAVLMLVAAVPNTTTVYAATNVVVARNNEEPKTLGNITIQVSNAAVNEKVGNEDILNTRKNVASAAAVDENGATYILWLSGTLYLYSYKYKGKNGDSVPIAYGVDEIKEDGYYSGKTRYNYLTDSEVKQKLGITNNGNNAGNNNSNNNGSNNNNNTNGLKLIGDSTVIYTIGNQDVILSNDKKVAEVAETDGVVYIRYANGGSIKKCKVPTSTSTTVSLDTVTTNSTAFYKENGKVVGYYENGTNKLFNSNNNSSVTTNSNVYASIQSGKATLFIFENGNITKTVDLLDKGADGIWKDSNGTCYIKSGKTLYVYNYSVQKDNAKVILVPIEKNLKDTIVSNGVFLGYTTESSAIMQKAWSLDQVKAAIYVANNTNTNSNSNTSNNANTSVVYASKIEEDGAYTYLLNSEGKRVDYFKFSNGTLTYHGKDRKNISRVYWNKNGNLIIKMKKSKKTNCINHISNSLKTVTKYTKKLQTRSGFATYVVKTTGTKINLAKY